MIFNLFPIPTLISFPIFHEVTAQTQLSSPLRAPQVLGAVRRRQEPLLRLGVPQRLLPFPRGRRRRLLPGRDALRFWDGGQLPVVARAEEESLEPNKNSGTANDREP